MIPNVVSIAGSDPSGGAGIQADLKAFSAMGAYGMTVITALTAQSTTGVRGVMPVPADWVTAQIDALAADVRIDAVKIGMLGDAAVIDAVADALERYRWPFVVLDTVMVAKSGHRLLDPDALGALRRRLVPIADLITPNLPEAADLLGEPEARDEEEMAAQAGRLIDLGARRVLLKGGHLTGIEESTDLLVEAGGAVTRLHAPRVHTTNDHGTGCTLSSAIAALRPRRADWPGAVADAKAYLSGALADSGALDVGSGHGPVHHFWQLWDQTPPGDVSRSPKS
ncbi:bifunctional hydroxymethylpyrimidine kinase/phosphomethylpyrimidine kinase [Acidiferrimicrobium sp. IK]|uniref:bifunctional hydroxymethylpyrimidine kinase/phosphomethylpyrimidine kinase n=1 Tax=Acidiferrimicrobium sp. IK TaxID=2871700 RepID=UPI0021CB92A0|nr:bifunctional hydroxymethylpyrimidine kinase/phosphomethylpyrimidine kinase [Acidiferrimicrobium sp. IK]MCU4186298.1 bifunctional hydroxymethylpyrimidine kinase/phosphomethylpyrimidine kinase [Acidiferrimicrobium sp. IK]